MFKIERFVKEWHSGRGCIMALSIAVLITGMFFVDNSVAQDGSVGTQQSTGIDFNVPPQPLGSALNAFAVMSGWQISAPSDLTAGIESPGVTGNHTAEQGLQTLLSGTGLMYRMDGVQMATIERGTSSSGIVPAVVPPLAGGASEIPNGTAPSAQKPIKVPEVLVKDVKQRETAELGNLPPEYPGGQVASGGRVGMLGNRNIMDTPFTQMSYTSKLIQDQQTRFLGDVLRNDPSVQINQSTASAFMNYSVRGFIIGQGDTLFNGLAVAPVFQGTMMTEGIERVEVLRGPNALLHGSAPGGSIGGMVNVVPKRAGDEPLNRLTAQYMSDTQVGGHVDLGRRFGSHKQFGAASTAPIGTAICPSIMSRGNRLW